MHEVLALDVKLIVLIPIAADGQNLTGGLLNSHHVRQRNTRGLTLLVLVLKPSQVQVDVHLKESEPVVLQGSHALLLGLLLLDVVQLHRRLTEVHI